MTDAHKTGGYAALEGFATVATSAVPRSLGALVLAGLITLTAISVARGQDAGSIRINIAGVTELEYPNAQAVVNLEDTSGASLGSLGASNFTVKGDGVPMPVSNAELASSNAIPLDVTLLMDTSGSTEGEGLAQAKSAAIAFIQGLAPEDRVAVMRFANSVTLQQDFTTDKQAAINAINALSSRGQTELYKATDTAVRQAATSQSPRRAMILLTDGASDAIETGISASDAMATATSSGVPVFTIAQGAAIQDPTYLIDLAGVSNGRYLEAPTPGDLSGVYQSIGRLLQNQYVVTFDASSAAGKPETAITVQVDIGGRSASATSTFKPSAAFVPPSLTITGLTAGENIDEPRDITVSTEGTEPIQKAAFYVDGVNQFEVTRPPFTYTYDPDNFAESEHSLSVSATIAGGIIDGDEIAFSSVPSSPVAVETSSDGGGGGLPIIPIAIGMGILAAIAAALLVVQRLRVASAPSLAIASPDQRVTPFVGRHRAITREPEADGAAAPSPEDIGEALGVLVSRAGSDAGQEYAVGGKPVSIGYGSRCAVRIDDANLATEEARIWIRNKTLMLHRMTRLTTIAQEGTAGGWTMLDPGETFEIGDHVFEFKLLPEGAPSPEAPVMAPATPTDVPNILKDKDDEPSAPASPPQGLPEPGMAQQTEPRRLTDMMPRDLGFNYDELEESDQQAS